MPESNITKQAIVAGMKQLMQEKSFDKITISDITKRCGLNRQTFYYHYQDKYELLHYIFYNEAVLTLTKDLSLDTWPEHICAMLTVMYNDKGFYRNAVKSSFLEDFHNYLFEISTSLFTSIFEQLSVHQTVQKEDLVFLARFFSYGVVGSIISWIQDGMCKQPEAMKNHIVALVDDCKNYAAKRYIEEHTTSE